MVARPAAPLSGHVRVAAMKRELMLLDRLNALRSEGSRDRYQATTDEDLAALADSVRRNLVRILNSRHGMAEAAPDYGLPALSDMIIGVGDHVRRVQEAIRHTINRYEPRLRGVRVTHLEDEGGAQKLVFRIEGMLVSRSGDQRVWYETAIDPTGKMNVSG